MDVKRNLLLVALAIVSYLMLLAWNQDYPVNAEIVNPPPAAVQPVDTLPQTNPGNTVSDLPQVQGQTNPPVAAVQTSSSLISISTPFQIVTIDLRGGDIVRVALPQFPASLQQKTEPFVLLDNTNLVYIAQSGLTGVNGTDTAAGRPLYRSVQTEYSIVDGELTVDLTTN